METVPKIVYERLKARALTVDHPDPDVLTAFSERSLPKQERDGVLEHLARCGQCRQVVALALPAEESAWTMVRPMPSKWLTWPRLRWGMIAAGVIVIGSFGVLRYRAISHPGLAGLEKPSQATPMAKEAKNQPEPLAAPPAMSQKKAEDIAVPRAGKEFAGFEEFGKLQAAPRDKNRGVGRVVAGPLHPPAPSHGPKPPVQPRQQNIMANSDNNLAALPSQAAPPPLARGADNISIVTAQAPASGKSDSVGTPVSFDQKAQNKAQKQDTLALNGHSLTSLVPSNDNTGGEVARAKPAETTANATPSKTEQAYAVASDEGSNFSPSGSLVRESPRWAITPQGGLERSLDQGKTWQEVDVNGGAEMSAAANRELALKDSQARVAARQKTDRKPKPIVFRAVAASGPDVWAGGSEANLYHSTDSGQHWVKVVPSWRGVELSGDILSLQFADVRNGRIVTSTAEIWTTPDDGQTWDKR